MIQQSPTIGDWLRVASPMTRREQWAKPGEKLGQSAIDAIRKQFNVGWWSVSTRLYGPLDIVEASQKYVAKAFDKTSAKLNATRWVKGDTPEGSPWTGVPVTFPLANANWYGARGGHLGFSPVMTARGDVAMCQFPASRWANGT